MHRGSVEQLEGEKNELEGRLGQMITVEEHESLLNAELAKADKAANDKFEQIRQ